MGSDLNAGKRKLDAHIWAREAHEHYVEPEWCSRRLIEDEGFEGAIWDPACGFGTICESARKAGHTIVYSDLCDRGYDPFNMKVIRDFLDCDGKKVENIISNPPFNIADKFALHALTLALHKVAMVFPTARLNAAHWLKGTPLRRVWMMTPRPSMPPGYVIAAGEKPGGGKMDYCWLVWEQGYVGPAEICWLRRDIAPAGIQGQEAAE
jgi:hypothetical protein